MTNSISLIADADSLPRLPVPLLRQLRQRLFDQIDALKGGALRISEPDGTVTTLGDRDAPILPVEVRHPALYAYAAFGGSTGLGQAWILGLWNTTQLVEVARLFVRNRGALGQLDGGLAKLRMPLYKAMEWRRRNTLTGSSRNISAHYDLGNDFFKLFLDDSMTYSSAIFPSAAANLAEGQRHKYDLICRKLNLTANDELIEIGTGWGGFALHAAGQYGAKVTTTTISQEQFELAQRRVREAGLADRVTVVKQDYRTLRGQYDKLVSIEMIEAVGHDYLPTYFRKIQDLLRADGEALIQAITIQDEFYAQMRQGTDFIRQYIFPGGHLPCNREMLRASGEHTSLRLFHLEDFGLHYARTLSLWRETYHRHIDQVIALGYNRPFRRMWDYYLASCQAGFAETTTSVVHAHFTMPGCHRDRHTLPAAG